MTGAGQGITRRSALAAAAAGGLLASAVAGAAPASANGRGGGGGKGGGQTTSPTTSSAPFGTTADGQAVERWTFGHDRLRVTMLTYGATIQSVLVPDRRGKVADVSLGQKTLAEYEALTTFFGATIGRYANRIAKGRFTLDGTTYQVPVNDPGTNPVNALHGGPKGFNTRVWGAEALTGDGEAGVRFTLVSPDGDQGFPGELTTTVDYVVTTDSQLVIRYRATTTAPTVLNLTNHVYFNLAGESSGSVYGHELQIAASRFTPIDAVSIPLGPQRAVAGTPFDFRTPHLIGERITVPDQQVLNALGYDHNWVFDDGIDRDRTPVVVARDPGSGRVVETFTDQPGVQFYSGNFLTGSLVGPGGRTYRQGAGFTLETQHFPDSPHQPGYPSTVLRPGQEFTSWTRYRFSAR
ncbi:aldose epimerase family protein [Quadrisphaera oryzae]|uniref:aldose epimerase family protein n=1 Tax=Quadrisphaera TaxID=317661 RepID=UPI00351C131F